MSLLFVLLRDNSAYLSITIFLVLFISAIAFFNKDESHLIKKIRISFIEGIVLSFIVVHVFQFFAVKLGRSQDVQFLKYLWLINFFEVILKNLTMVLPALFLIPSQAYREQFGLKNISVTKTKCLLFCLLTYGAIFLGALFFQASGSFGESADFIDLHFKLMASKLLTLNSLLFLFAIFCKEFFFRGVFFAYLKNNFKTIPAIFTVSILSTLFLASTSYLSYPHLLALGFSGSSLFFLYINELFISILYERTNSLFPPILVIMALHLSQWL